MLYTTVMEMPAISLDRPTLAGTPTRLYGPSSSNSLAIAGTPLIMQAAMVATNTKRDCKKGWGGGWV